MINYHLKTSTGKNLITSTQTYTENQASKDDIGENQNRRSGSGIRSIKHSPVDAIVINEGRDGQWVEGVGDH